MHYQLIFQVLIIEILLFEKRKKKGKLIFPLDQANHLVKEPVEILTKERGGIVFE